MGIIFDKWTCSWESVKVFETENISTWGGLEPPTFGFMPNALTYWAIRVRHLLSHVVEYWLWRYRYFWSKVNIWNVNCVWATAFIFDTWKGVLGKVSKFLKYMPWSVSKKELVCILHFIPHLFCMIHLLFPGLVPEGSFQVRRLIVGGMVRKIDPKANLACHKASQFVYSTEYVNICTGM